MAFEQFLMKLATEVPNLAIFGLIFHQQAKSFKNAIERIVSGFEKELKECHSRHKITEERVDLIVRSMMKGVRKDG